jgi:hypothetical protein
MNEEMANKLHEGMAIARGLARDTGKTLTLKLGEEWGEYAGMRIRVWPDGRARVLNKIGEA